MVKHMYLELSAIAKIKWNSFLFKFETKYLQILIFKLPHFTYFISNKSDFWSADKTVLKREYSKKGY